MCCTYDVLSYSFYYSTVHTYDHSVAGSIECNAHDHARYGAAAEGNAARERNITVDLSRSSSWPWYRGRGGCVVLWW